MMEHTLANSADGALTSWTHSSTGYQAYQILHIAFTVAPIIAGLDKFFHLLVNWDMYLAPTIADLSPIGGHGLMLVVGIVEIMAGILVAVKPRVGAYIVHGC